MAFKLPRLKANLAVVNQRGQPLDYFLRFWNMDVAPSLEAQISDLTEITAELQYQLGLIQAAQAAAESAQLAAQAAQNTANDALSSAGSGARYTKFYAVDYVASVTINNVGEEPSISINGGVSGGVIDTDTDWVGEIVLTEEVSGSSNVIFTLPIRIDTTNIPTSGGFLAGDVAVQIGVIGTLTGSVKYTLQMNRISGSNYVNPPTIDCIINITPKAT